LHSASNGGGCMIFHCMSHDGPAPVTQVLFLVLRTQSALCRSPGEGLGGGGAVL
jgi:hypothetical protein